MEAIENERNTCILKVKFDVVLTNMAITVTSDMLMCPTVTRMVGRELRAKSIFVF